jgi:hypothetical protein
MGQVRCTFCLTFRGISLQSSADDDHVSLVGELSRDVRKVAT